MTRETIQRVLDAAVRAPSGENCQPWRFTVKRDTLTVYNIPERDQSPYNYGQFGSFVAHGALIENIVIAAAAQGHTSSVTLFPPEGSGATAKIVFTESGGALPEAGLYDEIAKRATNRTPYDPVPFTKEEREILLSAAGSVDGELMLREESDVKEVIARALGYGDRLLFENHHVHDFLFSHISWNKADAAKRQSGFYVKELGLAGVQEAVFKLLKRSAFLSFFNKIGFSKAAEKSNFKLYADSSAIGAVVVAQNVNTNFLRGGRLLERVWLTATKLGYDLQPIAAIPFFRQRAIGGEADVFSREQVEGVKRSYATLEREFGTAGRTIAMVFRIGKGRHLPSRSFRMRPEVTYL